MTRHGNCVLTMLLVLTALPAMADLEPTKTVVDLKGDQHFTADQTWAGKHYRVHGNLYLDGGTLTVENATVEIMCEFARHHKVAWRGGSLVTRDAVIGGTKHEGVTRPTVFEVNDGTWTAMNTTVQYSCGILFSYQTKGTFDATNLRAGENPDSIIVCGKGDVSLKESVFDIALHLPAWTGGETTLDLPIGEPINEVFDGTKIPGADYRLKMIDSQVPTVWFVFFVSVGNHGEITHYKLRDCTNLVPGLTAIDLKGEANLPSSWSGTEWPGKWAAMPKGTEVSVGSLRVSTLTDKTVFAGWGVYLNGKGTDVTLSGSTIICELMVNEGQCKVLGTEGTHDMWVTCTTTDARDGARLLLRNVNLAYPEESMHYKQISSAKGAKITLENVVFGDRLHLITEGGDIDIDGWQGNARGVTVREGKGAVSWNPTRPAPKAVD